MILNFNITNFGSIKKQQTLSFEAERSGHLENFYITKSGKHRILKIALIYGANASGKTTVLKAFDFLRTIAVEPKDKKADELDFHPYLFDKKSTKENSTLSIEFIQNGIKYFYEVEFNRKAIIKEILKSFDPNKALVYQRTTDLTNQFSKIDFGGKIKINKTTLRTLEANTLWNNSVLGGYLKTNIEIKELKEVSDWFKDYLRPLVFPSSQLDGFITSLIDKGKIKKENVLTILRKADLNISNIIIDKEEKDIPGEILELLENNTVIPDNELEILKKKKKITSIKLGLEHLVDGKKYTLPFALESAGTKRFYGFAGLLNLLITEQNAFPIDELAASLHPDLYQYFLLIFLANAKNSQIIATTHNRELLNDKDMIRDDVLWITDKSKNAYTELYSFADFDSSVIRDSTNRLNAYKSGKLGGVPNVSDYYLDLD